MSHAAARDNNGAVFTFEQKIRAEQDCIMRFANKRGLPIYTEKRLAAEITANNAYEAHTGGNEHDLFVPRGNELTYILKLTNTPNGYGAKSALADYLENLVFSNIIFGDDVHLIALVKPDQEKAIRVIRLLIAQPFIIGSEASESHIQEYMKQLGFLPLGRPHSFMHPCGTKIYDARPANILEGADGMIFPIDVQIVNGANYVHYSLSALLQSRYGRGA